jgi:hypothetical protein
MKVSRTVLRRGRTGNRSSLFGNLLYPVKYSVKLIQESGIFSGTGLKEDIPISPNIGLLINIGILMEGGNGCFLREINN